MALPSASASPSADRASEKRASESKRSTLALFLSLLVLRASEEAVLLFLLGAARAIASEQRSFLLSPSERNSPEKSFKHQFTSTEDPLVGAIAQQLLTDREGHDKTAAEWTRRYAQG